MTQALQVIPEVEQFDEGQARAVTRQIRTHAIGIMDLIGIAYNHRIWIALGYADWNAWVEGEFADIPLALPRETRQHAVQSLTAMGLTTRAIAAVTGVDPKTVRNDQRSTGEKVPTGTADGEEPIDVKEVPLPDDKVGLDGRTYSKGNRKKVVDMIEADPSLAPRDIAAALNMNHSYVRGVVRDLKAAQAKAAKSQAAQPKPEAPPKPKTQIDHLIDITLADAENVVTDLETLAVNLEKLYARAAYAHGSDKEIRALITKARKLIGELPKPPAKA